MKLGTFVRSMVLILTACSALSGCVVTARPAYYGGGALIAVAPPAPQVEVVGVAPFPGAFWIGGYWRWTGERHEWVRGRWEAPREGYRWVPHTWVHERGGWRLAEGHWAHR